MPSAAEASWVVVHGGGEVDAVDVEEDAERSRGQLMMVQSSITSG